MKKTELKNLIRKILIESDASADKAHKLGLHHTSKGVWAERSGKKVAVSAGDDLIKYTGEPEKPAQRPPREPGDIQRQMKQYQDVGRQAPSQPSREPVQVPDDQTAQDALAQRKVRQQIVKPGGEKLDVRAINPEWYNNLEFDLEEEHGISPDDISPDVMNALYQQKLTAEDAAIEYLKIKDDVKQIKAKECQRMAAESIKRLVGDEFSLISERWENDVDVQQTGEHKDKSIEQLKSEMDAIEKRATFNRGEWSERMFAVRAKQGWKGTGSTGT